jgi:hypothetical protein
MIFFELDYHQGLFAGKAGFPTDLWEWFKWKLIEILKSSFSAKNKLCVCVCVCVYLCICVLHVYQFWSAVLRELG